MKPRTLIKYSTLLILFGMTSVILFIVTPLAKTPPTPKFSKHWEESQSEPYSNPVLANASPFDELNSDPNNPVAAGTPEKAIKYDIRLDTNCAIDQSKFILEHLKDFSDASEIPGKKIEAKMTLSKIAAYPKLEKINTFELLNLHNALQSQMQLSLNQPMIEYINNKCAKRVYFRQLAIPTAKPKY